MMKRVSPRTMVIKIKKAVTDTINWFDAHVASYVEDPSRDFTRKRCLTLPKLLMILLTLKGTNMPGELVDIFKASEDVPTPQAVLRARSKLHITLFEDFLRTISLKLSNLLPPITNRRITDKSLLDLFDAIVACDGSDIVAPVLKAPPDGEEKKQGKKKVNGYHQLFHVDALLDLCKNIYVDAKFCLKEEVNEQKAMIEMMGRATYAHALIILDRGYESFESMYRCFKRGWDFLIRVKDIDSNGICKGLILPDDPEFDISISLNLVNRKIKGINSLIKAYPNNFKYINWQRFSAFPSNPRGKKTYKLVAHHMEFRIVRIKLKSGNYEVLMTSLPRDLFPPERLKQLYWMRWGIETSFRRIKYPVNLSHIHSVKSEYIYQELYCRFIMFNIASAIAGVTLVANPEKYKYVQDIDFTAAVAGTIQLLRNEISPTKLIGWLSKQHHSIIPEREFERKPQPRNCAPFNGRGAA